MRTYGTKVFGIAGAALFLIFGGYALADDKHHDDDDRLTFSARLSGFKEAPPVLTDARGRFHATLHGDTLKYKLKIRGFDSFVRFAHIHFGQRGVNGAVMVFLCDNVGGSGPPCPQGSGKVTGELTGDDVREITGQGLTAGDFAGFIRALKANRGYVNVHSDRFPPGELRGDVKVHD